MCNYARRHLVCNTVMKRNEVEHLPIENWISLRTRPSFRLCIRTKRGVSYSMIDVQIFVKIFGMVFCLRKILKLGLFE